MIGSRGRILEGGKPGDGDLWYGREPIRRKREEAKVSESAKSNRK